MLHPQTSDDFDGKTLLPIWQWNHNPVPEAWSLTARRGWLRIKSRPAAALGTARNTLTQKIWDDAGVIDVKMDAGLMKDGRRAGFAFMSASHFGWIGVGQENGVRRIAWENGERPVLGGKEVWFRGVYSGDAGSFSTAWTAGPISIRGRCSPGIPVLERRAHRDFQLRFGGRIDGFRLGPLHIRRYDRSTGFWRDPGQTRPAHRPQGAGKPA